MILNLNSTITDHNSQPVVINGNSPTTLSDILEKVIPQVRTTTDEEALMVYGLLLKITTSRKGWNDQVVKAIEVSDEEFSVIKQIMSRESLLIKVFFLNMVNHLNPKKE